MILKLFHDCDGQIIGFGYLEVDEVPEPGTLIRSSARPTKDLCEIYATFRAPSGLDRHRFNGAEHWVACRRFS